MSELHKAYHVLGLYPGTTFDAVKRRYKRLVLVWHPDRMPDDRARREAEEELKKINNAFDLLNNHFDKQHRPGDSCACQSQPGPGTGNQHDAGDCNQQSTDRNSADEQRRRQKNANRHSEQQRASDASKHATETSVCHEQAIKHEQLRWQLARVLGTAFVLIVGFSLIGNSTRDIAASFNNQLSAIFKSVPASPSNNPPLPDENDLWKYRNSR